MTRTKASSDYGVQAVAIALKILELLAASRSPRGVTELAGELQTTKPRVFRHLRTLAQYGYVVQEESGKYRSGPRMLVLAQAVGEHLDIVTSARPQMRALREKLGHTVMLAGIESDGIRILEVLLGKSDLQVSQRAGAKLGFHYSALGKIALAFGPSELLERIASRPLEARTPHTLVSVAALKRELLLVRKRGWAHAPNEGVIGLNALAAPIFDGHARLAGIIAILGTIQFIPEVATTTQINALKAAARGISRALGYVSPRGNCEVIAEQRLGSGTRVGEGRSSRLRHCAKRV